MKASKAVALFLCSMLVVFASVGATAQLASTPPMGWDSWNAFGLKTSDSLIRAEAAAMASNGMQAAGYTYVNIDDGWQGIRDQNGNIQPNSNFPDMVALAKYVHSLGLKIGYLLVARSKNMYWAHWQFWTREAGRCDLRVLGHGLPEV